MSRAAAFGGTEMVARLATTASGAELANLTSWPASLAVGFGKRASSFKVHQPLLLPRWAAQGSREKQTAQASAQQDEAALHNTVQQNRLNSMAMAECRRPADLLAVE